MLTERCGDGSSCSLLLDGEDAPGSADMAAKQWTALIRVKQVVMVSVPSPFLKMAKQDVSADSLPRSTASCIYLCGILCMSLLTKGAAGHGVSLLRQLDHNRRNVLEGNGSASLLWKYPSNQKVDASPVISASKELLFIGTEAGDFTALSSSTGADVWVHSVLMGISSGAILVESMVLVGLDQSLVALNVTSGQNLWTAPTSNWVTASAVVWHDLAFIGSTDNTMYAVYLSNGSAVWQFASAGAIQGTAGVSSNGVVVFGSSDQNVYGLAASNGMHMACRKYLIFFTYGIKISMLMYVIE